MRTTLLHLLMIITINSYAQTANDILLKTIEKCNAIESGFYEMDFKMKFISGPDTTNRSYECYFKKLNKDPYFPTQFHYKFIYENKLHTEAIYNARELVNAYKHDSSGIFQSVEKWGKQIESISHNYTFYDPFNSVDQSTLPSKKELKKELYRIDLIGKEIVNEYTCYHIKMILKEKHLSKGDFNYLKKEFHFWIDEKEYYPLKHTTEYKILMNNDTMVQYELFEIKNYQLNQPVDDSLLSTASIPSYFKIKEYTPYQPPKPLPIDTIAPEWKHISLDGDSICLSDLKGKLVLADFFYKSCYPCMLSLPDLQWLHENFYESGLRVIGLDPVDTKEANMKDFLDKRGVSYPVLYSNKGISDLYRVSGYPTLYLIDKNGKILHHQKGYGKKMKKELTKVIKNYFNENTTEK